MKNINPLELFLWTFRRNEKDVTNLYDSLTDVMRLATGGNMLNFGYWDNNTPTPLDAQKNLCTIFGKTSQLKAHQRVVDVGSGLTSPAKQWRSEYNPLDVTCININFKQLRESSNSSKLDNNALEKNNDKNFHLINATATKLPFENESLDRVLALESAQHFKPLKNFISESYRILKKNGILALAIPVMVEQSNAPIVKLGLLSMTWSSEHYSIEFVKSLIKNEGFSIEKFETIGSNVYEPLANYYTKNRVSLQNKIKKQYPSYVEKILFQSLIKMKNASEKKVIDYVLITCLK